MIKIYPSLMAADLLNLEKEIKLLENHCTGFHIDLMDFHFVDNLIFGPDFVNAIRKATKKQLWIQLMVEAPEKYISRFKLNQGDIISIHGEGISDDKLAKIFKEIKNLGLQAGLAINPLTPIEIAKPFFKILDQVLLMSVEPGFSGQKFLQQSFDRIKDLEALKNKYDAQFKIALDGGVNLDNFQNIIDHKVEEVVIGSAIFKTQDPLKTLNFFLEIADKKF